MKPAQYLRLGSTDIQHEEHKENNSQIYLLSDKEKSPEILRFQDFFGGDKRDRTADLLNAIQALSQLSYTPIFCCGPQLVEPALYILAWAR